MGFEAKVVTFAVAASTTTGTLDVTSSGFGTPQGVMIVLSGSPNDSATLESDAILSVGITDGTNDYCTSIFAEDASGNTDTTRTMRNDGTLIAENDSAGLKSTDGEMTGALITDGIQLSYVTGKGFNRAYRGYAILMKGADNLVCDDISLSAASADFDTYGFKPDIVFFQTTTAATNGTSTDINVSLGWAVRGAADSISQVCVGLSNDDNKSTVVSTQIMSTTQVGGSKNPTSTGWNRSAALDEWRTNGFGLTRTGAAFGIGLQTLAIKLPSGQEALCGQDTSPTSATNKSVTTNYSAGTDDSELAIIVATKLSTSVDRLDDETNALSLGAVDSAGNEAVASISDDDGHTTSQSGSAFLDSATILTHVDGNATDTVEEQADMTNMLSPDLDINYSTADSNAMYFGWCSIQKAAAAGGATPKGPLGLPLHGPLGGPM